jgi:hypothetical protein
VVSKQVPQWHMAFLAVNSPISGGSGGLSQRFRRRQGVEIAIHEMGHTAFGSPMSMSTTAAVPQTKVTTNIRKPSRVNQTSLQTKPRDDKVARLNPGSDARADNQQCKLCEL